jgi:hypothetical protein
VGITESLRLAQIAEHYNLVVSPHFLPALFIHLAGAAPSIRWMEDFPLLEPLFDSPASMDAEGNISPSEVPGHGLVWADRSARRVRDRPMRICRYNDDKLGLIKGDQLIDVTIALDDIPKTGWPRPHGDAMIANIEAIKVGIEANRKMGYVQGVKNVTLKSPIANPTKIIAAPANYRDHVAEAKDDAEINFGREIKTINEYGLFLKANSALVGPGEGITLGHTDRRNDHEIELALIIGKTAKNISYDNALDVVAGYSIGLDNTVRGVEDRSLRKSLDSYAVLGPMDYHGG